MTESNSYLEVLDIYHGQLPENRKQDVQDLYMNSTNGLIIATSAFGVGINKSDIQYVYHYGMTGSILDYAQESGRAVRSITPDVNGDCTIFTSKKERKDFIGLRTKFTPLHGKAQVELI